MNDLFKKLSGRAKRLSGALLLVGATLTLSGAISSYEKSPIQFHTFKTHSRLVFRVDQSVPADAKVTSKGFEIIFKGIGLADLGAPLGQEQAWINERVRFQDSRLEKVTVEELPGALKVTGAWKFPKGDQAPMNPRMEYFEYRGENPFAQYVLDFWPKSGPTVAEARERKKKDERTAAVRKAEEESSARQNRRLATQRALSEAEQLGRFCELPLSEEKDVFLAFEPVHEPVEFKRWFPVTTPDSDYHYLEPKTDSADAQYVRLALKLYQEGKSALAIKTIEFLEAEHPKSNFLPEMRFLRANAYLKLGYGDQAIEILKRLKVDSRELPVALHGTMFLAAKAFEEKSWLAALDEFLWLINHYGSHRMSWVFRFGAAESLYALKQTGRAAKEYEYVAKNAPDRASKAQAALRLGDVYLDRRQYEQALAAYFQGINQFEAEAEGFPSVHLNRAESLYWIGQYDRAEEAFKTFLSRHRNYPAAWRATFRLGEIEGRRKGEKPEAESRKWFLETINRFPYSPGATLARIRLMPCGDHGGFTADGASQFFTQDAALFDAKGEVVMEHYGDFKSLAHVRSLVTLGKGDEAVQVSALGIQRAATPVARRMLGEALEMLMRRTVLDLLAEGKAFEALAFYQDKVSALPRIPGGSIGIAPDYLLKLSQTASDLELGTLARELARSYDEAVVRRKQGRLPAAHLVVGDDEFEAKLKLSEQRFTQAKALWATSGAAAAEKVRGLLADVIEESEFSYGREIILGLIEEKAGKLASALAHAVRAQLLIPRTGSKARDQAEVNRIGYWVASLQERAGESRAALRAFQGLRKSPGLESSNHSLAAVLGIPPVPTAESLLMAEGEILVRQEKWGEAAKVFSQAVEDGIGGNSALYQYYRTLGRSNDPAAKKRSHEVLRKLAESEQDDFWRKLARQALENNKHAKQAQPAKRN